MINIVMADDHAIVREGMKQIVSEEDDIKVVGEANDAEELFEVLRKVDCDIVILDLNMPGKTGLDALKDMKVEFPELPVLILSMYDEDQYGIRSLKAGASGYLRKVSAPDDLVLAIRKIVSGGKYISPALAESLANNIGSGKVMQPHEHLSDREYEVLCKIASGKTADEIAHEISISIHTVYSYRNRIMDKMQLKSNVELTQYAIQNKLLD
ncbi:MAG: response regulator transcription factor [Bacteroidetes bacterium]|nr:response regulator transcription factor [Bacteroidota bacterium]